MLEILKENWLYLLIGQYPSGPLGGLALTLAIASIALTLALPAGIVLALGRVSHFALLHLPATGLVYLVRGLPLIMVIFWAYFLVPLALGRAVPGFVTMIYALVFFEAAYLAEIVRAGIQAVPKGQVEAARSLGLNYLQTMRGVVLPQALRNMLPSLVNQFVALTKDTSLAFIVGINELTYAASQINNRTLTHPAEIFLIVALMYFLICFSLTAFARHLESRLAWGR
ncbi:MAG TPA: amino acid ABC transporter permease [Burkholderiales bacterium]|jgi:polar amino acid transport system permease protein|nr:amino acid ABC transporter permease [Burkholderiales bacterium]